MRRDNTNIEKSLDNGGGCELPLLETNQDRTGRDPEPE